MKVFYSIIIFCTSFFACREKNNNTNDNADIRQLMNSYNKAFSMYNWAGVLKLIHPKAFDFISKRDFEKALDSSFNGDGYEIRVKETFIDSIYPIIRYKSEKYSLILMKITSDMFLSDSSDKERLKESLTTICNGLQDELKEDFVSCYVKENRVEFTVNDKCYAVYLPEKNKWFILSKDEDSEDIVNKIIPKKVRLKLGY